MSPIYMDHHSTTPVDGVVLEKMLPYFTDEFGNAASSHEFGRRASEAVETARAEVATLIDCKDREIIFTSGATESCNLAIKGVAAYSRRRGNHLISVLTEHHAVLDPCKRLSREGFDVSFVPVDSSGVVDPDRIGAEIRDNTILISVMAANNEVGTLQPIAEIGTLAREAGVLFHTDATQLVGKDSLSVRQMHVDLLSCSAHKLYGPKGIGCLFVRRPGVRLRPLMEGGGHERNLRSGTVPVPLVVGFGECCRLASERWPQDKLKIGGLRDRLWTGLKQCIPDVSLNGTNEPRLAGNLNVSFAAVDGEALLMSLKDVAVSSGSACSSASPEPSYVLRAMGVSEELARASIRFGLGRGNTEAEVDLVVDAVAETVRRLRSLIA